jgi:hypothetical protein
MTRTVEGAKIRRIETRLIAELRPAARGARTPLAVERVRVRIRRRLLEEFERAGIYRAVKGAL